ncbi:MAG: glycerophosphodiester phosphodiesterase family protein, partial [Chitinophagaceae bacterium]
MKRSPSYRYHWIMNRKRIFKYTLLVICFFAACQVSKKSLGTNTAIQTEFDKQGHRGCRGLLPENTVPAMLYALGMGVTTLEMDVVITKDKKVILSHEPFFNHEISTKP